jgi:hypothetical protein
MTDCVTILNVQVTASSDTLNVLANEKQKAYSTVE